LIKLEVNLLEVDVSENVLLYKHPVLEEVIIGPSSGGLITSYNVKLT